MGGLMLLAALWPAHTPESACPVDNPSIGLRLGSLDLQVEVAHTAEAIACGLSARSTLPRGQGMLFVHPHPDHWSFWMRNTRMPLSLLFLDHEHRVSQIAALRPQQGDQRVHSQTPVTYALEIHPQDFAQAGITLGTQVTFTWPTHKHETQYP